MSDASDLSVRFDAIVARLGPEHRATAQHDVDRVRAAGIQSDEDLLRLASDEQGDAELRAIACWLLGRLGDPQAVPVLVASLEADVPRVREAAARALGELADVAATAPLLERLAVEQDAEVRRALVSSLGAVGNASATAPLRTLLLDAAETPGLRGMAAEALAELGDTAAVDSLVTALSDREPEVRFFAAFALGELGTPRALPALQERIDLDDDAVLPGYTSVREEAAAALDKIRARGGLEGT